MKVTRDNSNTSATSNVYYISSTGSDSNDGKTWKKAFATINAAVTTGGGNSTYNVSDGTFPVTAQVTIDHFGSIRGAGTGRTIFDVQFDGIAILYTDTVATATPGTFVSTNNPYPGLSGFTIQAGTGSGNSTYGVCVQDIVFAQLENIYAKNFTGSSAAGIVIRNVQSGTPGGFDERLRMQAIAVDNNTVGILCDKTTGDVSQAYQTWNHVKVNCRAVASGANAQIGVLIQNGVQIYHSRMEITWNITGTNGANTVAPTAISMITSGGVVDSQITWMGEGTAGTATSINMDSTGLVRAFGLIDFLYSATTTASLSTASFRFAGYIGGNGLARAAKSVSTTPTFSFFNNNSAAVDTVWRGRTLDSTHLGFQMVRETDQRFSLQTDDGTTATNYLRILADATIPILQLQQGIRIQSGANIYSGSGAPSIANSAAGDYYLRTDTPTTGGQKMYIATATNTWIDAGPSTTTNAFSGTNTFSPTSGATTGISERTVISPVLTQSSTAGYTALKINPTETSVGSGVKKLLELAVGGVTKAYVKNDGVFFPVQAITASAPTYVEGGMYYDTTLHKLRIGGASGWESVTSV